MKVLGIIPARGGSKGVKNKNILEIKGKPLIGYTIEAALQAQLLDRMVVSTDSKMIADVVKKHYKIEVIMRPPELAQDDSPIEEALLHSVEHLKESGFHTDIVVWMQANVPIRKGGMIDEVVDKLIHSDADSCVTCYEADQIPEWMKVIDEKGYLKPWVQGSDGIRRQEVPVRYLIDGSVLAMKAENLIQTKGIRKPHVYLGQTVIPVLHQDRKYTLEVDIQDDIDLIQYFMSL
ncbi:MAG: hypothetical protein IEMM0008_0657 [bacterium]|nr:MAG: hypothetical protein IEMM0008_0657 [bacterium]